MNWLTHQMDPNPAQVPFIRFSILGCILLLSLCISAGAQNAPENKAGQTAVAATPTITYTLPPDKLRQSEALYKLDMKFLVLGTLYSWLILLVVLRWGIAARYRNWAESVSCYRIVQAFIFVPLLLITLNLASLPLSIYGHHIALQYGLSVQKWGSWFADYGKGRTINIGIYILALWHLQTMIRWSPRRWWFYYWLAIVPVIVFFVFITPIFIDPLFNRFEPLEAKNPQLVEEIEKVTQRGGLNIPRDRMYEMKASEKVTTLNAYVTGFGASKRVVVWDTTIQKMTTPETLFVFGHEMGHYVLHHIIYGLVATCFGILIVLYILFRLSGWMLNRFGQPWHIRNLRDWAVMPAFLLLGGILFFLGQPVANTVSRYIEHQADIYGLEVTHGINPDPQQTAAHSFQVLGELSLDYPYPDRLAVFWFWTHPPISDRVRFSQEYDPWSKGESPKYVRQKQ
ncbi:MAG TPA: M48 family metallopeptidase [Candidatus Angelobacter sp.]